MSYIIPQFVVCYLREPETEWEMVSVPPPFVRFDRTLLYDSDYKQGRLILQELFITSPAFTFAKHHEYGENSVKFRQRSLMRVDENR